LGCVSLEPRCLLLTIRRELSCTPVRFLRTVYVENALSSLAFPSSTLICFEIRRIGVGLVLLIFARQVEY
jgi:hypothetical protein